MDLIASLATGFDAALTPALLAYCFAGCVLGTLVGVLPGLGPAAVIAMLLPATYLMPASGALVMMAAIYYGTQYAGSTGAILANKPGASSSVVTCVDGYQMARQGRAGAALWAAGLGSFVAGCVGTLVVAVCAYPVAELVFRFGPAEYFSLMVTALVGAVVFASGSIAKALAMIVLGLLMGSMGNDVTTGWTRFTLDVPAFGDTARLFAIVAMGLIGYGEMMVRLSAPEEPPREAVVPAPLARPLREDMKAIVPAVLRGTVLGSLLGVLPGGGALLASFASYALERTMAGPVGEIPFGKGNIRGVAAPESANNAGAQTSFVPLLTLGIPPNAVMALIVGAMTIHSIQPGPQVMTSNPQLFWGLIASMWIGNAMLLALNLPLVGLWAKLLAVPYRWLYPAIVLFCAIGVYSTHYETLDVWLVGVFGFIGYLLIQLGCEPGPLLMGFVLAPTMEENLRRALQLSRGDWSVFLTRPWSAGLLACALLLLLVIALPSIKAKREEAFVED
jgi:putative tricarboxylic transport membrane protein